ncbi:hypothetical protein BELL_0051g00080 [Botrytis elliptica]|uniref:Uncharacterized protein n=1 Tax=Botrytis elliptica TaxID=278938 RepID=A0A4Z1JZU2_9HELO|nr:hypothetical protein BELL_0051g00080 [Botrytis elliptica]
MNELVGAEDVKDMAGSRRRLGNGRRKREAVQVQVQMQMQSAGEINADMLTRPLQQKEEYHGELESGRRSKSTFDTEI